MFNLNIEKRPNNKILVRLFELNRILKMIKLTDVDATRTRKISHLKKSVFFYILLNSFKRNPVLRVKNDDGRMQRLTSRKEIRFMLFTISMRHVAAAAKKRKSSMHISDAAVINA